MTWIGVHFRQFHPENQAGPGYGNGYDGFCFGGPGYGFGTSVWPRKQDWFHMHLRVCRLQNG